MSARVAAAAHPRLIILCGLPGAGKTTLARRLETAMPAVRLCPDEWMTDLGIDHWDDAFRDRLEAQLTRLALALLAIGQSVILEYGFWRRAERDQKRAEAHALGVPIDCYYLNPPLEEVWRRLDARNQNPAAYGTVVIGRAHLEEWAALFQAPDAAELALFDRAAQVPDARGFPL
ncbi:MAG TPA: ATP-binding protein [Ktedonobacterales bacterium]